MKNCNSSRLPWEEVEAPKAAAAHSLGTTDLLLISKMNLVTEISIIIAHYSGNK